MSEIFSVGDAVTYADTLHKKSRECKIIKVMPTENAHAVRHYRIRDSSEPFERAVPGAALTLSASVASEVLLKACR